MITTKVLNNLNVFYYRYYLIYVKIHNEIITKSKTRAESPISKSGF